MAGLEGRSRGSPACADRARKPRHLRQTSPTEAPRASERAPPATTHSTPLAPTDNAGSRPWYPIASRRETRSNRTSRLRSDIQNNGRSTALPCKPVLQCSLSKLLRMTTRSAPIGRVRWEPTGSWGGRWRNQRGTDEPPTREKVIRAAQRYEVGIPGGGIRGFAGPIMDSATPAAAFPGTRRCLRGPPVSSCSAP